MFARCFPKRSARIVRAAGTRIHDNLAFESLMIDALQPTEPVLFLWQNSPCIVVGRYQNAWGECDVAAAQRDGVAISRRFTGGGAVFHDLGNVCFSVVAPKAKYCADAQNDLILGTLRNHFGIDGVRSGRNDLCLRGEGGSGDAVVGAKFSGQSFRHVRDHSLHNGTIMLSVDVEGLGRYLTPDASKLAAKGVKSVKSRVANLSDINPSLTPSTLTAALAASFAAAHGLGGGISGAGAPYRPETVADVLASAPASMGLAAKHAALVQRLSSWDFIFGETPQFSHALGVRRLSAGTFDLRFDVEKGVVKNAAVFSDALDASVVEGLRGRLAAFAGSKYERAALLGLFGPDGLDGEIRRWIEEAF